MDEIKKMALVNSGITALYVVGIGIFMNWITKNMDHKPDTFLDPIVFLMIFVFSAAFTSYFMLGRPVMMFIDGKKKESISLLSYTLVFFFVYTVIALLILIVSHR